MVEKSQARKRLRRDLKNLGNPPSILIKKNVCQILEPMLADGGYDVLNRGRVIYFQSTGQQKAFHQQFSEILRQAQRKP